jgi:erythromycin esterase-like protein
MKGLFTVLFSLCLGFSGISQTLLSSSLNYDFDFSRLERGASTWKLIGRNYIFSIGHFDQQKVNNIFSVSCSDSKLKNAVDNSFECKISQLILLQKPALRGLFSLDAKAKNIEQLWVKIYCLDKRERIIRRDSIFLTNSENWKHCKVGFNLKTSCSIYIEIGSYCSKDLLEGNRENVNYSLSKLSLMIDGKDILTFPHSSNVNTVQQIEDIKKSISLSDKDDQCFSAIDDLKTHRLVALGETVSGSISSQECAYELMKQMIRKENCRLILLDYPLSSTIQWNQYVHGELQTKSQEFLSPLVYGSKSPVLFESFLEWVKEYNQHCDQKVTLTGFDVPGVIYYNYLADYLNGLNLSSPYFDSLFYKVCKRQFKEALEFTSESDSLSLYLKPTEINLFVKALKNINRNYVNERLPEVDKSFIRFNNIKEIISSELKKDKKVIIYADFSVLNRLNVNPASITSHSVGYWLDKEYKNNFFTIAIVHGNGAFTHSNTIEITPDHILEQPIIGSIEDLCIKSGQRFFYKNVTSDFYNRLGFMRWIDRSEVMSQFERCNYKSRMDAIIFIKNSKGFDIPPSWPKNDKGFYDFNAGLMQKDFELHFNKKFYRPTRKYRVLK